MVLVDKVRSSYGYTDEYILEKPFAWVINAVDLISRREYEDKVMNAQLIASQVSNMFADKNERNELQTYDELLYGRDESSFGNHDEAFDSGSLDFLNKAPKLK